MRLLQPMAAVLRAVFVSGLFVGCSSDPSPYVPAPAPAGTEKLVRTEAEWREALSPEAFRVLRESGTERRGSGAYNDTETPGVYACVGCGLPLFSSDAKYHSGSGWPSFWEPLEDAHVSEHEDGSGFWGVRTEVRCTGCDGHLGHVFADGPQPTGLRYCINSVCLDLRPR